MPDEPTNIYGPPDEKHLESRLYSDMCIVQGVLELVAFADYVDRLHHDDHGMQLPDRAINQACWGAAHIAQDAAECIEVLQRRAAKGDKQ